MSGLAAPVAFGFLVGTAALSFWRKGFAIFMARWISGDAGTSKNAVEKSALEASVNTNQRAHTETHMKGPIGLVGPLAFRRPVVGGSTVTTSSTSKMESGAVGRRGNEAGRHVGEAEIVNRIETITRMRKSDNRAEARERALGKKRIAIGATDSVAQRTERCRIGAVVAINGAVNKELNAQVQDSEITGAK